VAIARMGLTLYQPRRSGPSAAARSRAGDTDGAEADSRLRAQEPASRSRCSHGRFPCHLRPARARPKCAALSDRVATLAKFQGYLRTVNRRPKTLSGEFIDDPLEVTGGGRVSPARFR
jgi:hypothetical protein